MSTGRKVLTFDALVKTEPRLAELYAKAAKVDSSSSNFCANAVWYGQFKPALEQLVGFEARKPLLRSRDAYDLAYDVLYDLLPDCRHEPDAFCV
jgi:hypothetical protein